MTIEEVVKFCRKNDIIQKIILFGDTRYVKEENVIKNSDNSFSFNCDLTFSNSKIKDVPFKIKELENLLIIKSNLETCSFFPEYANSIKVHNTPIKDLEENWNVKEVREKLEFFKVDSFKNLNFLTNTKFENIICSRVGDYFMDNKEYESYVKKGMINYKTFQEMVEDGVVVSNKDIEELDQYIMEI